MFPSFVPVRMRSKVVLFLLINIIIVGFLLRSVWTLLTLLVVDGADDAISRAELPAPNSELIDGMPRLIPKIIHQTYANESVPEVWQEAQQSCVTLHQDYEYKLWTDKSSRQFIADEYPWFIETWDSYPYAIQRADAIRYFVLAHYGGIYVDLDDGCQRRLDPMLAYPAWVRRTKPTGISNDVMGAVPGHPFFLRVIDSLPRYNRNWFSPYVTIMGSTGPLFLSLIWRHYSSDPAPLRHDHLRILFPDDYMGRSWSFFTHHVGNSWHKWDTQLILWMSRHWVELTIVGFVVGGAAIFFTWVVYYRVFMRRPHLRHRYFRSMLLFRRPSFSKQDIQLKEEPA